MKKMYKYILIITIMMFSFETEVRARDHDGVNKCVEDGKCNLVCSYGFKNKDNKDYKVNIYYYLPRQGKTEGYYYSVGNGLLKETYDHFGMGVSDVIKNEKKCPPNIYFDEDYTDEACFDLDGSSDCVDKDSEKFGSNKIVSPHVTNHLEKIKEETGLDASHNTKLDNCVNSGECKFLCQYESKKDNYSAIIYYFPNQTIQNRYKVSASWVKEGKLQNIAFTNVYSSEAYIIESDLLKLMNEGICPQNMYRDPDGKKEICFDNSGGCMSKSKFKDHEIEDADITSTNKLEDYLNQVKNDRKNELACEKAKEKIASEKGLDNITEICGYTRINPGTDEVRQFFVVTIDNNFKFFRYTLNGQNNKAYNAGGANEWIDEVTNVRENNDVTYNDAFSCKAFNHFYTSASGDNPQWRIDEDALKDDNMYMFTCSVGSPMGYDKIDNVVTSCETLLGEDLRNEINSWFLYIKIAVPIILIVMGSLDFGKAFISSDEDAMKKAQKKFIMRLIIAIVIFFIPAIVNALLNIGDQVWNISNGNGTCKVQF